MHFYENKTKKHLFDKLSICMVAQFLPQKTHDAQIKYLITKLLFVLLYNFFFCATVNYELFDVKIMRFNEGTYNKLLQVTKYIVQLWILICNF